MGRARPGPESADAVGNHARAPIVADETCGRLIRAIAAEKRQIDEARHPEPHVIEPDENAKPVIGKQAEKDRRLNWLKSLWL